MLFIGGGDEENPLKNMTDQYCIINVDTEQEVKKKGACAVQSVTSRVTAFLCAQVPMKDSTLVAFGIACLTAEAAAKATFTEKKRSIPMESLTFDALSENFSRE